jgi:hypothetical protein
MGVNQAYKHRYILATSTLEALGAAGALSLVIVHLQLDCIIHHLLIISAVQNDGHYTVAWPTP